MIEFDREAAGRVIRRLRQEKGLSQEVLSGFAGLARSHLGDDRKRRASSRTLKRSGAWPTRWGAGLPSWCG